MAHVPPPPPSAKPSFAASIGASAARTARLPRQPGPAPVPTPAPTSVPTSAPAAPAKSRRRGLVKARAEASILEEALIRRRLKVNVRTCRKAAGLTLKMVSERADMHWRHWQKIEAGQVNATLHTLVRVAEALAVEPFDLVREPASRKAGP